MVGEFEKPKYFSYKERLCAHSRNQLVGCNACVEICSAGAIEGAGDLVKVNPYLCAGCGACTTVCPTGAISYAYPSASHTGGRIKTVLQAYADAGGEEPVLLLHGLEGAAMLAQAWRRHPRPPAAARPAPHGLDRHRRLAQRAGLWRGRRSRS
jgi:ferredoxin